MKTIEERKKIAKIMIKKLKELIPEAKTALNYSTPWELLMAVILSAQTTDKTVNKVTETLFKKYKNVDAVAQANLEEFTQDIHSVNFYRNKAKNIIATAKIIQEKYKGKVPDTMEELLNLPGVARKTANVILSIIYDKAEGVVVDTHVRRLSNLHGLTDSQDPVKIEKDLVEILPKEEWRDFSFRMIDYGRQFCPARPHDHDKCPITVALQSIK